MTVTEAKMILDPETTVQTIAEIEYYAGFNRKKVLEKVDEACGVAAEALAMQEKLRNWIEGYKTQSDFSVDKKQLIEILEEFVVEEGEAHETT